MLALFPTVGRAAARKEAAATISATRTWNAFIAGHEPLMLAAADTVAALKSYFREKMRAAYADFSPCADADRKPGSKNRTAREQLLGTVLWRRWQQHMDSMENMFYEGVDKDLSRAGILATLFAGIARHTATSAMLRADVQKKLKAEKMASAVQKYDVTQMVRLCRDLC